MGAIQFYPELPGNSRAGIEPQQLCAGAGTPLRGRLTNQPALLQEPALIVGASPKDPEIASVETQLGEAGQGVIT